MKHIALALTLAASPLALSVVPNATFAQTPADFSAMVSEKLPAVVGILSTIDAPPPQTAQQMPQLPPGLREFFDLPGPDAPGGGDVPPPGPAQSQGSGFIISPDGYVVTNNHVIAGASSIAVMLENDQRYDAELVGTDPATDIALLRLIDASDLPTVAWGSSDDLMIGDWVVAIGNPFGLGGTVTAGILSARSRNINAGPYDDFLQTDAAINRGNSGGPLFDADGQVVGVNTAIFSPTGGSVGIGFAVPQRVAQGVVQELRETGQVSRGWLGVQIQTVTGDIARAVGMDAPEGALVADVTADSPAQAAGLRPGDIIVALGDTEIDGPRTLSLGVAELDEGDVVGVTVYRDGDLQTFDVTLGSLNPTEPDADTSPTPSDTPQLGLSLAPLDDGARAQLGITNADINGLVVAQVAPGSPAARAGVRAGDVILNAGMQDVETVDDITAAVTNATDEGTPLLLRILRNGNYTFLTVSFDD